MDPVVSVMMWMSDTAGHVTRHVTDDTDQYKNCIVSSSYSAACETDRATARAKPATKEMGRTVKLSISV